MNLTEYYLNIYPTKCPADTRFLASKEGLILTSRTVGVVFLPVHILTTYCVLKKTPANMSSVKFSLENLSFWLFLSQILFSFFMMPSFYLPVMGGTTVGFATDLGVPLAIQFYMFFALSSLIMISIVLQFENRSSLILKNKVRINGTRHRIYWVSANFFTIMFLLTVTFLNLPDQNQAKIDILKTLPCPTKEFFTEPFIMLAAPGLWEDYMVTTTSLLNMGFIFQVSLFSSCCIYYLFIDKSSFASPETQKAQARSFIGIVLQTFLPILLVVLALVTILKKNGGYDQVANNLMFIFMDFHSGVASLSILLVQHPYRKFLISFLCKKKKVHPVITVSTVSVSS
ncbi:Serpentine Receptor, class H [Caenorhabditis elegans]|uniref:Serpentine Receptor, class H n=1 Tax=Caenorhabditis elegans TaxID=6239 RepID=O18101_CAEEL|nr:Serpentine Receptor, class H [Caenorhabditis elegans]CAB03373.1 Serpentine Receptor, class H [Caenorhabditis elegans]|eukprot:NP_496668.1 Serpentine Receptor, class H [Caenorhabditis elegans]